MSRSGASTFLNAVNNDRWAALMAMAEVALKESEAEMLTTTNATELAVLMERTRWAKRILNK